MKSAAVPSRQQHHARGFARNIELLVLLTMAAMAFAVGSGGWKAGLLKGGAWPYLLAVGGGAAGFLILPLFAMFCILVGKTVSFFRK